MRSHTAGRRLLTGHSTRRGLAILAAIALVLTGCGGSADEGDGEGEASGGLTKLVDIHPSGTNLIPLYFQQAVAEELGFFEEEGIDVEVVGLSSGSASAIQQIVAGNGDVSNESPQVIFDAIEEGYGDDIRIFGTWLYEQPFSVRTYPDSDIETVEDLAGKKIGVSESAGGEVTLLQATLKAHGITDYELVPIGDGSPQTMQALQNREVDAYSTASKDFLGIEAQGVDLKFVAIPEWEDLTANIYTVNTKYLEQHRDAVVGYLRALAKASLFAYENLDAAVAITEKYQEEGTPDYLVRGWVEQTLGQTLTKESIEAGQPFAVAEDELNHFLDFYQQAGAIESNVDINLQDYIDDGVVDEAGQFDQQQVKDLAANHHE